MHFFLRRPLIVVKPDQPVLRERLVYLVHIIVDAFIHRFNAVPDKHLSLERLCLVYACQFFQLTDQFI